jgi:hypothetical protein
LGHHSQPVQHEDPQRVAAAAAPQQGQRLLALLLGVAATVRRIAGMPLPPGQRGEVDRVTRVARQALGEDDFASTFARGAALPMEDGAAVAQRP